MCIRRHLLTLLFIFLFPDPESDEQGMTLLMELNNDEPEDFWGESGTNELNTSVASLCTNDEKKV